MITRPAVPVGDTPEAPVSRGPIPGLGSGGAPAAAAGSRAGAGSGAVSGAVPGAVPGAGAGAVPRSGAADAPPFRLPGEHFAAALTLWALGAIGLVGIAPDLAAGLFPLRRVVATTHLFTLGWITTSILGALYQFLPVALRTPIRSQRVAHLTFALFVPGVAAFVAGFLTSKHPLLLGGAGLLASGLVLFLGNLAATLARVPRRDATWWSLAAAGVFLLVTLVLGVALSANLGSGYLGGQRFLALGVHLHVAIAGWVFLVIIGVARHLLPMFLLSHVPDERPVKLAGALVGSGVLLLAALHHAGRVAGVALPALLIGGGVVAFLVQGARYFRHSRKPALDPGMRLAGVALAFFALSLLLAPAALPGGVAAPRLATGYVAAMVLGISLFVAAHYYKILPFLVWYHRFGPVAGKQPVPRVADLYGERTATLAGALLALGALGVVSGVLAGAAAVARAGALAYAAGAGIEIIQMSAIARRRPE